MHAFSSWCWKANGEQAGPMSSRKERVLFAVNGWAGHFVSWLISCGSSSVPKGAEAAGGVFSAMGADEFLGWLSVSPSVLHLTELFVDNVQSERLSQLLDQSQMAAGSSGLPGVEMEGESLPSDTCSFFFSLTSSLGRGSVSWLIGTLLPTP